MVLFSDCQMTEMENPEAEKIEASLPYLPLKVLTTGFESGKYSLTEVPLLTVECNYSCLP